MKKIILTLTTFVLAFAAISCQKVDSSIIKVGTSPDYPPFESLNAEGEMIGFDIDMVNAVARIMGEEIKINPLDFSVIISSLNSGQVDLGVSGFTYSPDRDVLFSEPYYMSAQALIVKAGSSIKVLDDLKDKRISAGLGTTGESAALEAFPDAKMVYPDDYMIGFEMLKSGQTDAVVCDLGVAQQFAAMEAYEMLDEYLAKEEMSIIIKKGNTELLEKVNTAIKTLKASDEYETLLATWELN